MRFLLCFFIVWCIIFAFFSQSINMKDIVLTCVIALFFICVILYPFKVKIALHFNVFEMIGFVSIKALCFKLFSGKFLVNDKMQFELEKQKRKIKKKKKPISLLSVYFLTLAKRLSVKKYEWYFTCGSNTDASLVSLLCGYVLSFDAIVSSVLLNSYSHVKIYNDIDPIYDSDRLEASSNFVVSFCLLDMFISLFVAYKKYFELLKEKKNAWKSNKWNHGRSHFKN